MDAKELASLSSLFGRMERIQGRGFERLEFKHRGRECRLAMPSEQAPGGPWILRAQLDEESAFDLAMLKLGWHVGSIDCAGLYGCLERMGHLDELHYAMSERVGLSAMPCMEARGEGALCAFNWAAANPTKILCVYGERPVCDIRSWPGGQGSVPGDSVKWKECLDALGLDEAGLQSYKGSPLDRAKTFANFGVPVAIASAAQDPLFDENGKLMAARVKEAGGRCELFLKEPGSAEEAPAELIQFASDCWLGKGFF